MKLMLPKIEVGLVKIMLSCISIYIILTTALRQGFRLHKRLRPIVLASERHASVSRGWQASRTQPISVGRVLNRCWRRLSSLSADVIIVVVLTGPLFVFDIDSDEFSWKHRRFPETDSRQIEVRTVTVYMREIKPEYYSGSPGRKCGHAPHQVWL